MLRILKSDVNIKITSHCLSANFSKRGIYKKNNLSYLKTMISCLLSDWLFLLTGLRLTAESLRLQLIGPLFLKDPSKMADRGEAADCDDDGDGN